MRFGFDLELFAEIVADQSNSTTDAHFVLVILRKKVNAIWIRLLTSLNHVTTELKENPPLTMNSPQ